MRYHRDLGSSRDVVMLIDQASEDDPSAEQRKCRCGDLGSACAFRAIGTDQVRAATAVGPQAVDGVRFAPEEEPRSFRNVPFSRGTDFWDRALELHQAVSVGVRERIQYDAFERGIDCGAGADAERECQYGDEREART